MPGQRGGHLEPLAAFPAFALGHLGHQENRLEPDGHRLQLPKPSALPTDLPAPTARANLQLRLDQQKESNAPLAILGAPILVALTNPKGMIQQTLTHASYYPSYPQTPTSRKNPESCVFLMKFPISRGAYIVR